MNYNEAMKYIHEVGIFGSNYGLERTQRLLELLGNPHKNLKLIHIAGTNGKGSITAMITEMLKGKCNKVGMYTSPFLEEFEERIQINGVNIPKNRLASLVEKIREVVDKVIEEGLNHPTEFEIITALMLLYFSEEKVDYGVIEVGLGGRLDSTNVITPILSVIASISLDHTNLLGTTIAEIAGEKAGIIKANIPVIIYPQKQEAYEVLKNKAKEMNSKLYEIIDISAELIETVQLDRIYQKLKVKMDNESFFVNLPLLGEHQINNFLTALKAFKIICEIENLEFNHQEIIKSISKVQWIGRLEVMNRKPLVVIDGAHNIQGIKALRRNVEKYFKYKNVYLLLGILADKQVHEMIEVITPFAKKVITLTPMSNRAELAEDLMKEVEQYNKNCISMDNYEEAYKVALKEAGQDDLILISGSLYMIGDMRKVIRKLNK